MDKRTYLLRGGSVAAIALWVGYWMVRTRYALLDDALIHLHYADFLHRVHFITFDGTHHTFGTSSLLYVSLLAFLRGISASALVPKAVSDVGYVALVAVLVRQVWKSYGRPRAQIVLAGLLLCLLSPMGVRWLTDGMETGLTNLAVVLLALVLGSELPRRSVTGARFLLLALFGAAVVYLRIELSMLIALACVSLLAAKLARGKATLAAMLEASPLAVGALLAMVSIRLLMGNFLPDTALAKSAGHFTFDPVGATVQVMAGALLYGAGTGLCWMLSVLVVLASGRRPRSLAQWVGFAAENGAIVMILGLACVRGQVIQGVRYFVWAFVFAIVANSLRLARFEGDKAADDSLSGVDKMLAAVFCLLFLAALPTDWRWAARTMEGRSQTFLAMRGSRLGELFAEQPIVAADVGFISYFTNAYTCDTEGLVNGRVIAAETRPQRAAGCAKLNPVMLFATRGSFLMMQQAMSLDGWKVCGIYDFTNVHNNDRHYLVVPPQNASRVCGALQFSPLPAETIVSAAP